MSFEEVIKHINDQIELAERRIEMSYTTEREDFLEGQIDVYRECLQLIEEMTL